MTNIPVLNSLLKTITGTATITLICLIQTVVALAKTGEEIYKIAVPVTVKINTDNGGGTGVIISRSGNTYTVVTNHHVVCPINTFVNDCKTNNAYQIITHSGRAYTASFVQPFQRNRNEPDLAIVQFNSSQAYSVATLGDSQQIIPGSEIYVYGFPGLNNRQGADREEQFTKGYVTSRPQKRRGGYTINYTAWTWAGMSGGPVFDSEGRLIAIHGQGDIEAATVYDRSGQYAGVAAVKSGINSAVPINTFVALQNRIRQGQVRLAVDSGSRGRVANLDNPTTASDYYARGAANFSQGKLRAAVDDFTKSLRLDRNNRDAYISRGNVHSKQKDYKRALADYNKAIQLDPNYATAYYNRGFVRYYQKDYQGALADYNKAIQLDPNYATAYYNRGFVRYYQKDYKRALADFNKAIELDPNYAAAYNNRGAVRRKQKDYKRALADYNKAIQLDPNLADAYNNRGVIRYYQKDYKRALADYNKAIQLNPNHANAYNNRGFVRYDQKDYKRALADYNKAIQLDRNNATIYNNRGLVHHDQKDYQRALADYNKAIQLNPNDALAYNNRGLALYRLGEKRKAHSEWQTAAKLYKEQGNDRQYQKMMDNLKKFR